MKMHEALSSLGKKTEKKDAHPGFKAIESKIASKEGISKDSAGAILASAARKSSPAANKANPNLKKVK
jgi:hypothetical protein